MQVTGGNRLMGLSGGQVDGHAHVFLASLPMAESRRYTPTQDAAPRTYDALLAETGKAGAILVQPSFLGSDNSFLLETLRRHGDTQNTRAFRGVAVLDDHRETPDRGLLAEMTEAGIIGVRLNLIGHPCAMPIEIDAWDNLLHAVDAEGWHVEVQCDGKHLPSVLPQLIARCRLVVVDHFGLPADAMPSECPGHQAILSAPKERLFVKTSAPYRAFPDLSSAEAARQIAPFFAALLEELGPEQLVWGSDWPWTQFEGRHSYQDTVAWEKLWQAGA